MSNGSTSDFWKRHDPSDYSTFPGFLTSEETDELIETARTVDIEGVREAEGRFGPMFTLDLRIGDEVRSKSFSKGSIPGRDVMVEDLRDHLADGGAPVSVVLQRWGQGVGFAAPPTADDTPWPDMVPNEEEEE